LAAPDCAIASTDLVSFSREFVKPGFLRTAALLLSFMVGALVPQAQAFAWLIRWLVMGMLFLVFLQTRLSRHALHRSHVVLLGANLALGFVAWGLGWAVGGRDVALAAFFCGITPTATAAPVIVGFLRGRVDYVIAAFILTNVVIAALLPALMPLVLGQATPKVFTDVLGSVSLVVFGPMAAAWLVRSLYPASTTWPKRLGNVSFGAWVAALFLITARVSDFLRTQSDLPHNLLIKVAATSLVVCAVNFSLGRLIGGRQFAREASQSLGQKNTTFTIYLALTYANPLVAFGPTCYVLWHNLWNSWQLHRQARHEAACPSSST
jgi:BASS family bile acid:Na+ symporter